MSLTKESRDANGVPNGHVILCPACGTLHLFDERFIYNGNDQSPTFAPTLLLKNINQHICHIKVTDGKIGFSLTCTHELRGKTVPLNDIN